MHFRELAVSGAFEVTPTIHGDARGAFLEWYKADELRAAAGHRLDLVQANISVSARGTLRGVHFADVPPGQAKYVTCTRGAVIDFVVDIRVGSPTFGEWDSVRLDDRDRRSVYLAEGLGHAFLALEDGSVVSYLVSSGYDPAREHAIDPLDPQLALRFPSDAELTLSEKDRTAPSLADAERAGVLPDFDAVNDFIASLTR